MAEEPSKRMETPRNPDPRWLVRGPLSRHLIGTGLDLGPGHVPFPVPYPGTRVLLVDRWTPAQNKKLFPEPEMADAVFPEPDVICDLAKSSLDMFATQSMDFVVASHIIEHMPNPLGLLEGIHRVLHEGGLLILLVPDRRRTFDRNRNATPLEHVVADYENHETEVDEEHLVDSIAHLYDVGALSPAERERIFAEELARSPHVHCWTPREFNEVLAYAISPLGQRWELVEVLTSDDWVPSGVEFGYVLRKSTSTLSADERRTRFLSSWEDLRSHREDVLALHGQTASSGGRSRRGLRSLYGAIKGRAT